MSFVGYVDTIDVNLLQHSGLHSRSNFTFGPPAMNTVPVTRRNHIRERQHTRNGNTIDIVDNGIPKR